MSGQADEHTDMTKLMIDFRIFVKVSEKRPIFFYMHLGLEVGNIQR
jgi:hypothetical protein